MSSETEKTFVTNFIIPERQERTLEFLGKEKSRQKLRASLADFNAFKVDCIQTIPPNEQTAFGILKLLSKVAASDCILISEDIRLDGRTLPLGEALEKVVGRGMGTIIICPPRNLGFYEGEGPADRFILRK